MVARGRKGDKGDKGDAGLQGLQGPKGDRGIPGTPGANGKSSYTHIAYADTLSGGGFSQNPSGKKYIGTYTDFVQADSSDPGRYKWSLIKVR
ncbi:ORF38 [Porphyromonas crevioricanis JCM 15906]|uniref:ORF38 n=1 Tax=Porphyromonas crevioricanis JCM 15906 TaxID=1305617 RepID=S4NFY1_9PORP|nr:collagen-like protein [Porphyromonas crevioricanis]GAD04502.1 ORF38 [Porphyromonas crevioricanis JCM 15906]